MHFVTRLNKAFRSDLLWWYTFLQVGMALASSDIPLSHTQIFVSKLMCQEHGVAQQYWPPTGYSDNSPQNGRILGSWLRSLCQSFLLVSSGGHICLIPPSALQLISPHRLDWISPHFLQLFQQTLSNSHVNHVTYTPYIVHIILCDHAINTAVLNNIIITVLINIIIITNFLYILYLQTCHQLL